MQGSAPVIRYAGELFSGIHRSRNLALTSLPADCRSQRTRPAAQNMVFQPSWDILSIERWERALGWVHQRLKKGLLIIFYYLANHPLEATRKLEFKRGEKRRDNHLHLITDDI